MARIINPVFAFNDSRHVRLYFEDEDENEIMTERRHQLDEAEIKAIVHEAVKEAVDAALERLYAEIGKSLVKKVLWGVVIGVISFTVGNHLIK